MLTHISRNNTVEKHGTHGECADYAIIVHQLYEFSGPTQFPSSTSGRTRVRMLLLTR